MVHFAAPGHRAGSARWSCSSGRRTCEYFPALAARLRRAVAAAPPRSPSRCRAVNVYLRDTEHLLELVLLRGSGCRRSSTRTSSSPTGSGPDREWWASLNPMIPIVATFQKALYNPPRRSAGTRTRRPIRSRTRPWAPTGCSTPPCPSASCRPTSPTSRRPRSRWTTALGWYLTHLGLGRRLLDRRPVRRAVALRPARGQPGRGDLSRGARGHRRSMTSPRSSSSTEDKPKSAKERVIRAGRNPYTPFCALDDVSPRGRRGRDAGAARPQRLRQVDAAQVRRRHAATHVGPDHHPGPARRPARAGRRLPPRPHRARERLPERLDPRLLEGPGRAHLRRHRRLLRAVGVHRQAGEALLVGHVRPARLRGGHQRRARHPAGRRGALGRRRGVPAQVPRPRQRPSSARAGRSCS